MENNRQQGPSIFSRLFWAFLSSSVLVIVVASVFYYGHARQTTESQIREQVESSMREVIALFEKGYQTHIEGSLSLLETTPSVDNFLTFQQDQSTVIRFDIEKQFSQLIRSQPKLYRSIRFVDAFGQEAVVVRGKKRIRDYQSVINTENDQPPQTALKTTFEKLKAGKPRQIVFSQPFRGSDDSILFYAGIAKLEPEIGGFGGALIFECDLGDFIETLSTVRTYGYSIAWLLNTKGEIISQPPASEQPLDPRPLLALVNMPEDADILKHDLYPGSSSPDNAFLRVVLSIPPTILQQQNLAILKNVLLIVSVAILFTSVVAWLVSRQITRPITDLVQASQRLADGDFDTRSTVKDRNEIGILSQSFNQMAEKLNHTMECHQMTEDALHQSHEALELVLNSTGEGIYGIDIEGKCTFCNDSALRILGFSSEDEITGQDVHEAIQKHSTDGKIYARQNSPIFITTQTGQGVHMDSEVFWHTDGSQIPVEYRAHPIKRDNEIIGVVVTFTDITRRRQAEIKLRTLSQAVEQSPVSVILTDWQGGIEFVNAALKQTSGRNEISLIGEHILSLFDDADGKTLSSKLWLSAIGGQPSQGVIYSSTINGERWEQVYISPVTDSTGSTISYLVLIENITERKQQENKIIHQAHHDMLTGLPNRVLSLDRLDQLLRSATRNEQQVAVLFIDLDGFKKVNDLLGHEVGDKLLIEAARRLESSVRDQDTVGRLGGDEFIVLLGNLNSSTNAQPVAENILAAFRKPFQMNEHELVLTTSIGIAIYPNDGDKAQNLLRNADIAMYESKHSGRNTYHFFTEELNAGIQRRLKVEEQLHHALNRNELFLVYQPILELNSLTIVGAEALLRWNNNKLGMVGPDEFIPIAEQTGLISSIGDFVLRESISQLACWQKKHTAAFTLSVNASPRQFHTDELFNNTIQYLNDANVSGESLQLELTEGVLMSGHKRVEQTLRKLHDAKVQIAMDDFGTGYSSLSYLRKYPFDTLKIDRSFIRDIHQDSADRELVIASLNMAHGLGLKVVAEGIETREQLLFLNQHHCDFGQGYLFSKPVLADEFESQLLDSKVKTAAI